MYYYAEATMKQIGAAIGVNESRVSQLHARAVQRLRKALGAECSAAEAATALKPAILSFEQTMLRMKTVRTNTKANTDGQPGVVLEYKAPVKPAAKRRAPLPERERIAAAR
jgi:hypothetical protein